MSLRHSTSCWKWRQAKPYPGSDGSQKNPAKPSAAALRLLAEKLEVIEATGVLGI